MRTKCLENPTYDGNRAKVGLEDLIPRNEYAYSFSHFFRLKLLITFIDFVLRGKVLLIQLLFLFQASCIIVVQFFSLKNFVIVATPNLPLFDRNGSIDRNFPKVTFFEVPNIFEKNFELLTNELLGWKCTSSELLIFLFGVTTVYEFNHGCMSLVYDHYFTFM